MITKQEILSLLRAINKYNFKSPAAGKKMSCRLEAVNSN